MTHRSWSTRAAVALTGVLALGNCSNPGLDESSTTTRTSSHERSSSTSTARESSSGAGDLPEAATKNTKEGAAAFGRHYVTTMGQAATRNDTSSLEPLAEDSCEPCQELIRRVRARAQKHHRMDRNPYTVTRATANERPDGDVRVVLTVDTVKHFEVDRAGRRAATSPATRFTLTQHLARKGSSWVVKDWVIGD